MPKSLRAKDLQEMFGKPVEAVCYLTTNDLKVHLVDFQIEDNVPLTSKIFFLDVGLRKQVITTYNTLIHSTIYLTDGDNYLQTVVRYKDWSKYFRVSEHCELELIDDHYISSEMLAVWQKPQVLLSEYLIGLKTKLFVISGELNTTSTDVYKVTTTSMGKILGEDVCVLGIKGNIFRGFQKEILNMFNINISDAQINKALQTDYPDLSIENGIKSKYWSILDLFSK